MRHRTLIIALAVSLAVAVALEAQATEPGATFQDGICWEADGTEGAAMPDGQCVTPADYDAMFSAENLATIVSPRPFDDGKTIAEIYGLDPSPIPASERQLGEGVTSEPFTFVEYVHTLHMPVAS